jgi:hypothetical protein
MKPLLIQYMITFHHGDWAYVIFVTSDIGLALYCLDHEFSTLTVVLIYEHGGQPGPLYYLSTFSNRDCRF